MLSRDQKVLKTEWRLGSKTFQWVCSNSQWGSPTLDLFANRLNTQLDRYVSPCADIKAVEVDALWCTWPDEVVYAFSPTTILDRVVAKMQTEQPARLLMIAPWWPNMSWFPSLQSKSLVVSLIPPEFLELRQPHFNHNMENPQMLSLAMWCITFRD